MVQDHMFSHRWAVPLRSLYEDLGALGGHSVSTRCLLPCCFSGAQDTRFLQTFRAYKLAVQAPYSFPMVILLNVFQMPWSKSRLQAKSFRVVF